MCSLGMKAIFLCLATLLYCHRINGGFSKSLKFHERALSKDGYLLPELHPRRPTTVIHCSNDDDCGDFRFICMNVSSVCICSSFHYWDAEAQVCNLNVTELKHVMAILDERKDLIEELSEEENRVFNHLAVTGIITLVGGLLGVLLCILVFCIKSTNEEHIRTDQAWLRPSVSTRVPD